MGQDNPHESLKSFSEGWREVPFDELDRRSIAPGLLVSDIFGISQFNIAEALVVDKLSPGSRIGSPQHALAMRGNDMIAVDRIANMLKTYGLSGSLIGGYVAIEPFDMEIASRQATRRAQKLVLENHARTIFGLQTIYMGILRSSVAEVVKGFRLDTTYFRARRPAESSYAMSSNRLYRTAGYPMTIHQVGVMPDVRQVVMSGLLALGKNASAQDQG